MTDRLARATTASGAVALTGLGLLAVSAGLLWLRAESLRPGPRSGPLAWSLLAGAGLFWVGLLGYVGLPGLCRDLAVRTIGRHRTVLACLALALSLAFLLTLPLGLAARGAAGLPLLTVTLVVLVNEVALLGVLVWRVLRPGALPFAQFGLSWAALRAHWRLGVVGGLALFLTTVLLAALLRQVGLNPSQARLFAGVRTADPLALVLFVLVSAGVAPLVEELFFRGFVFGVYRRFYGRLKAYVFSAVYFAVVHYNPLVNPEVVLPVAVIGLALAYLYERSGSLVPAVIAHGLNNGLAALALVLETVATD